VFELRNTHHRDAGTWEKIPFRPNEQLQVVDFVQAKISILIVFGFFLMTAEYAWFDKLTMSGIFHDRAS
jgi:hypothetical protein